MNPATKSRNRASQGMADLVVDDQHRYWLGKKRLPSVTQILSALNFTNYDSPWFTEEALLRGSVLHQCIQSINEDDLDWDTVHPDMVAEVKAYEGWKRVSGFKPLIIEKPMYSKVQSFAGTADAFGQFPDKSYAVLDWKRGVPAKAVRFQLAMYVLLAVEHHHQQGKWSIFPHQIKRYSLGSIGTGKPKMTEHDDQSDVKAVQAMVATYHTGINAGIYEMEV